MPYGDSPLSGVLDAIRAGQAHQRQQAIDAADKIYAAQEKEYKERQLKIEEEAQRRLEKQEADRAEIDKLYLEQYKLDAAEKVKKDAADAAYKEANLKQRWAIAMLNIKARGDIAYEKRAQEAMKLGATPEQFKELEDTLSSGRPSQQGDTPIQGAPGSLPANIQSLQNLIQQNKNNPINQFQFPKTAVEIANIAARTKALDTKSNIEEVQKQMLDEKYAVEKALTNVKIEIGRLGLPKMQEQIKLLETQREIAKKRLTLMDAQINAEKALTVAREATIKEHNAYLKLAQEAAAFKPTGIVGADIEKANQRITQANTQETSLTKEILSISEEKAYNDALVGVPKPTFPPNHNLTDRDRKMVQEWTNANRPTEIDDPDNPGQKKTVPYAQKRAMELEGYRISLSDTLKNVRDTRKLYSDFIKNHSTETDGTGKPKPGQVPPASLDFGPFHLRLPPFPSEYPIPVRKTTPSPSRQQQGTRKAPAQMSNEELKRRLREKLLGR